MTLPKGMPDFAKVALPVRKGSIRIRLAPVSIRKQEWPNYVIFIVSPFRLSP